MKKLLIATLLTVFSTSVLAVGPVFEQGVDTTKTVACIPPITRTDGSALDITELDYTTVKLLNEDTNVTATSQEDVYCNKVVDLTTSTPGQYKLTATATDTGGRESINSEPAYFLLIPTVMPPNAPTGITIQ